MKYSRDADKTSAPSRDAIVLQKPVNMRSEAAAIMLQSIATKHPFKHVFRIFGTPIP